LKKNKKIDEFLAKNKKQKIDAAIDKKIAGRPIRIFTRCSRHRGQKQ
jgi:hypothetical protein